VLSRILTEIHEIRQTQLENRETLSAALNRVTALEQFKFTVLGISAAVSAVVGVIAAAVRAFYDHQSK
jgi:hypothetical protein